MKLQPTVIAKLTGLVESNSRYKVEDKLNKNLLAEDARKYDVELLDLLQKDEDVKEHFFTSTSAGLVFKKDVFLQFVSNKEFLPDSFTKYKIKIGLGKNDTSLLSESGEVVLNWPYKDCILEGGQDKEDQRRSEVFFNQVLAPDQITRLLDNKVFHNWKRYDKNGERDLDTLNQDDNLIINGNNLIVLHSIKKRYHGSIKLIYIDPPYNTGGDDNIFSYNNTFNHSTWLTFMRNRLEVAKTMLTEDGFIAIAIDHVELFYLGVLADEIFGRENRVGIVTVLHNPKGRNQAKFFSSNSEFMLVYAKDAQVATFNKVALSDDTVETFTEQDEDGKYRWEPFLRARTVWSRENRPKNWYPLFVSPDLTEVTSQQKPGYTEIYPVTDNGKDMAWKNIKSSFDELNVNSFFSAKEVNGKIRIFHKYREQQVLKNVWTDKKYQSEFNGTNLLKDMVGDNKFSYPKSLYTVVDTIRIMTSGSDIVMDFFGGSLTTAQAVWEANNDGGNRKFILIEQLNEHIEIGTKRMVKALEKESSSESFVFMALANRANDFSNRIKAASSDEEYLKLLNEAALSSFLSYRVDPGKLNENEFSKLSTSEKRQLLLELIDNNTLYVNYEDINDPSFKVGDADKKHNKELYEKIG